ncbi:hypothetical protein BGY98DRAFT_1190098 [Russula aff. rugulosa BPL654]|nr:hypothetical protein BGY98DRAFT_1190098 [Russula aff. rugulosa BPL654]
MTIIPVSNNSYPATDPRSTDEDDGDNNNNNDDHEHESPTPRPKPTVSRVPSSEGILPESWLPKRLHIPLQVQPPLSQHIMMFGAPGGGVATPSKINDDRRVLLSQEDGNPHQ